MNTDHFKKLEKMYISANINSNIYQSTTCSISEGKTEITLKVEERYFHALGAIHGSIYFKLLDDAAFFAVNSIVEDAFVLTTSFNLNLIRPASEGLLTSIGKLKFKSKNLFVAESVIYNQEGKEIGFGTGNFSKSKIPLSEKIGYNL